MRLPLILVDLTENLGISTYIHDIPPVIGSLLVYTLNIIVCLILQRLNSALTPRKIQPYTGTFLATLLVCASSLENGNIYNHHGLPGLFCVVYMAGICWYLTLDHPANPIVFFHRVLSSKVSLKQNIVLIVIQAFAGLAAYRYATLVWSLDIHEYHRVKLSQTACYSGLTVSVFIGFALEGFMSTIDSWLQRQKLTPYGLLDVMTKGAFTTYLVTLGIHMTGMFFNPAMASCHFFNCHGTAIWQHVLVYWVGPFSGCLLAVGIDKYVHLPRFTPPTQKATKAKKTKSKSQNVASDVNGLNNVDNNNTKKKNTKKSASESYDAVNGTTANTTFKRKNSANKAKNTSSESETVNVKRKNSTKAKNKATNETENVPQSVKKNVPKLEVKNVPKQETKNVPKQETKTVPKQKAKNEKERKHENGQLANGSVPKANNEKAGRRKNRIKT